ncbi:hypothetical protein Hdeb2414_s0215g00836081 [Helianthus debilis subsp. tardiflorus]
MAKKKKIEKHMGSGPSRRFDRHKKLVDITNLSNIKSTKEKTANSSKQSSEDVNEDKKIEKPDPDVGVRKRKRIRIESGLRAGDEEDLQVEDKSPQANTSRNTFRTSSYRIEDDLQNQQELDACHQGEEAFEKINSEWGEKRESLENDYKVDKCLIHALYMNPMIRSEKLKILERDFANKLEEHEKYWETCLDELKTTMLAALEQVAAEVVPTLPETPIVAQSQDEKEMVDATVSSEQIGELPAQQLDDDMAVDVAEKVDSGVNDMAPHVHSGDVEMQAGNYNNEHDEDGIVGLDTSHVVEDRHETVDNVAPEVESDERGTPAGTVGDLQPSGASQLDRIISDDEPDLPSSTDPTVAENPTVTVSESGKVLEENLASATETPHEAQPPRLATSVSPAPLVNALYMFDNLTNEVSPQMPNQTHPLQAEVERLYTVKENVTKFHREMKQRLNTECEKEIAEIVSEIRLKYEAKHVEADAAYNSKKIELETNIDRVILNRLLAEAFRCKGQDSRAGMMQQLLRLSVSPSIRIFHGQSSGNQQALQPPPSLPQPQPQRPLQIVHQPTDLFSTTPSRLQPPPALLH